VASDSRAVTRAFAEQCPPGSVLTANRTCHAPTPPRPHAPTLSAAADSAASCPWEHDPGAAPRPAARRLMFFVAAASLRAPRVSLLTCEQSRHNNAAVCAGRGLGRPRRRPKAQPRRATLSTRRCSTGWRSLRRPRADGGRTIRASWRRVYSADAFVRGGWPVSCPSPGHDVGAYTLGRCGTTCDVPLSVTMTRRLATGANAATACVPRSSCTAAASPLRRAKGSRRCSSVRATSRPGSSAREAGTRRGWAN
jgi:hypothetical protein